MEPTIHDGDYIFATDLLPSSPGDLSIVHFLSRNPKEFFIKRIVANEGKSILIDNGIIYINNKPRSIGPNIGWTKNRNFNMGGKSLLIPKGYSFVLGDNRNKSSDSRNLGLAVIGGKVFFTYHNH
jgi:signal peptidase I